MINKKVNTVNGVVINVSPYKDESAIVSFITEKGLFSVYVNNAYKQKNSLKPLLIPFNYLTLEYVESDEKFLLAKYTEIIKDYSTLLKSYKMSLFLQVLIQIITLLYSYENTFNLNSFLLILDSVENNCDMLSLLLLFIGSIYKDLGLKQNVDSCVFCSNKKNIVSFSLDDGGFICYNCLTKKNSLLKKDNTDLFIFKYAFSNQITESLLHRKVPLDSGIIILKQISSYLQEYFGVEKFTSIDTFINYLINKK